MPARISGSWRTSTVSNATPRWSRIATARLEKPHWGNKAVPFMNRTMSLFFTSRSILSRASLIILFFLFGCCRTELQCMQLRTHAPAQRLIDALVLADQGQAAEALGDDPRLIMVAVAGEVDDLDPSVRNALSDPGLALVAGPG